MEKACWFFLIAIIAASGHRISATQTRLSSLGPAAIFSVDDSDPWQYPAEINNYPNSLSFEMDSFPLNKDNMAVLGFWSDSEQRFGTFGVGYGDLFHQKNIEAVILALNNAIANNPLMSPRNSIPLPENKYHVFYAKDIGPIVAGLHLSRASGSKKYDFSDTIPEDSVKRQANSGSWGIETGVSAIIGDNIYVQSGLGYQKISFSSRFELSGADPLYWEQIESSDGSAKRLDLRMFYGLNEKMTIVPVLSYSSIFLGYSAGYGDTLHTPGSLYDGTGGSYSVDVFKTALGVEYRPGKNVKLVGGLALEVSSAEIFDSNNVWLISTIPSQQYKYQEISSLSLPGLQGGMEADMLEWLSIRLGASQKTTWVKVRSEFRENGAVSENIASETEFDLYVGLSLKFDRLTIDAQINKDQPYNLGYLISGISEAPFVRLSIKYKY